MDPAELRSLGLVELLDVELARALTRVGRTTDPEIGLAIALTSRNVRRGHTCFPLGTKVSQLWPSEASRPDALPDLGRWEELLRASALTEDGPLVLDDKARLYLRRYWELEKDIASSLAKRAAEAQELPAEAAWLEETLDRLFPDGADSPQRKAAKNALAHRVSLLCGGPGTGKTTTVAAIVAMIVERDL